MAKPLIIVESPAKARTIKKFVGNRFDVQASMGHIRDLPKSQLGVAVDDHFEPKYVTIRGKGKIVQELRKRARKAARVLLATDPDREGEAISWHLAQLLNMDEHEPCRIEFHEVTKEAVDQALKSPRPIDDNLVDAQQARRILDRLVGYKLSPLLWRKVRRGLSAGRVQSVAVRLICDREEEIEAFTPEEYWSITAVLETEKGRSRFQAKYRGPKGKKLVPKSEEETKGIIREIQGRPFVVTRVVKKEKLRHPPPPFTTSSMQQEASHRLGFSVRKTMSVAQQLYEGLNLGPEGTVGLITYIRTDSTRIADTARSEAGRLIHARFGPEYVGQYRKQAPKPGAQEAHEAIRPTSVLRDPERVKGYLNRDQYRLYRLVWTRFITSQMSPAVMDTVSVDISAGDHVFRATGSTLKFPGFMAVKLEEKADDNGAAQEPVVREQLLPELTKGETLLLLGLEPKQHFTQPPPRYTEAMLVRTLEEKGIGRPSTYAPIISTIQQRGYVLKEDRHFVPTELGKLVIQLLKENFPRIIDVEFTARMEAELDQIEEGETYWRKVLADFYGPFEETLKRAEEKLGRVRVPEEETDVTCEKCGRKMVIKYGRYGKFLACPGYPECKNTKPLLEKTGVKCPECGGEIVGRRSKKGRKFYGCSNYPECNFVSFNKPLKKTCPECGAFMVQKRSREKGTYYQCSRQGCGYSETPSEQV